MTQPAQSERVMDSTQSAAAASADYLAKERLENKAKTLAHAEGDPNWWRFLDQARKALGVQS